MRGKKRGFLQAQAYLLAARRSIAGRSRVLRCDVRAERATWDALRR
jgi:hypothetical protein